MRDVFDTRTYNLTESGVKFKTGDKDLKFVFDKCEELCSGNVKTFNDYEVLIEGSKYTGVWLETQPIGGEMYAKRNMKTAINNMLIFMRHQRKDGKLPGMISDGGEWKRICIHYDWMQGCFLPYPALKMYYHVGKDKEYLEMLYSVLSDYDNFLWRYRDSTGNGVLENWSIWDVGEDNCTLHMLHGLQQPENGAWGKSTPPEDFANMPHKSPQYMAYSYACRTVLAKISEILKNGKAEEWSEKAAQVKERAIEHLWDKDKNAFFVRDKDGEFIYALTQENIKCMYNGLFTQEMADAFIKEHLLNEEEFWTPYPLPAIAANSPYFHVNQEYSNCADKLAALGTASHDIDDNSWSGPLHGLVWQRSISALLNYGHHAETVLIGEKLLELLKKEKSFKQNYNPFTGKVAKGEEGYGPTMLAALEYISILYGVNIAYDKALWSACVAEEYEYTQEMYGKEFTVKCDGKTATAYISGEEMFSFDVGVRVETDLEGNIEAVYFAGREPKEIVIKTASKEYSVYAKPNEKYVIQNGSLQLDAEVPFDYKG